MLAELTLPGRADGPPPQPTRVTLLYEAKFPGYRFFWGSVEKGAEKRPLTEIQENQPVNFMRDAKLYVKLGDSKPVVWTKVRFRFHPENSIYHIKAVHGEGDKIRVDFKLEHANRPEPPGKSAPVGMIFPGVSLVALAGLIVTRRRTVELRARK